MQDIYPKSLRILGYWSTSTAVKTFIYILHTFRNSCVRSRNIVPPSWAPSSRQHHTVRKNNSYTHKQSNREINVVNNQQDATTLSFINLFKSAQHVSDDKFAHPQEHFLNLYTVFGTMHRHCCQPVPRLRWNISSISTVAPVGSRVGALYQKLYIQSKSGRICRPKHVGLN